MSCCVPTELWRKKALMLSKRGNIETELLLVKYIEDLASPTAQKRILLEQFLNENDQNLFNWLIHPDEAVNGVSDALNEVPTHYKALITEIRDYYLNSKT